MSNMLESMEITGGKARARRNYLPGFQGICMPCWLFCKPAVSCMFCLEAADCWLRSSVNSLAEASGEKDKAREKTHARAVFMLLFTIIARGCHWLMTASTLRISSSCPGQRNPTKSRIRQWIVPGAASFPFPQSPQMHEYEYFTKCMYVKVQSSACKAHPLLLSDSRKEGILLVIHVVILGVHRQIPANPELLYSRQIRRHCRNHLPTLSIQILLKVLI